MPSVAEANAPDYDLVCVGFGPAALAIAVAISDLNLPIRALYLEKQKTFAWHAGMLLPGAKMQISFLKDLATFRDPRSHFTFLNYLKENGKLEPFTNLSTFLPFRQEFNDYLTWAAHQFEHQVQYDTSAKSIESIQSFHNKIIGWRVTAVHNHQRQTYTTRNLIIATGGLPQLPKFLQKISPAIVHSSQYLHTIPSIIPTSKPEADLHLAVVGGGQSSAETFHDLTSRYPEAKITLYNAASALKPSDDSPFVNEIFNASLVSSIYSLPSSAREALITNNRATNYSVVRPELLDELYSEQYKQRLTYGNDPSAWRHRIINSQRLTAAYLERGRKSLTLDFTDPLTATTHSVSGIDMLVCGTGYARNGHEALLQPVRDLLASEEVEGMSNVDRNYKLRFRDGVLDNGCGIWLQGVCEATHGLSDSLLSILAVRAGEVVDDIFGHGKGQGKGQAVMNGTKIVSQNGVSNRVNGVNGGQNGDVMRNGGHANGMATNEDEL